MNDVAGVAVDGPHAERLHRRAHRQVATTSPTYVVVDDGGAAVATHDDVVGGYTASAGRSDLHIERERWQWVRE